MQKRWNFYKKSDKYGQKSILRLFFLQKNGVEVVKTVSKEQKKLYFCPIVLFLNIKIVKFDLYLMKLDEKQ